MLNPSDNASLIPIRPVEVSGRPSIVRPDRPSMPATKYPVFVFDTSVLVHNIRLNAEQAMGVEIQQKDLKVFREYVDLAWDYILGFGWCAPNKPPEKAVMIFVQDSKPYWRSEVFPKYKQGRKAVSPMFGLIESGLWMKHHQGVSLQGYEADDIAAALVKTWQGRSPNGSIGDLHLITIDTDWLGLVQPGVAWIDCHGYQPRVRREMQVREWVERKLKKAPKKHIANFTYSVPEDVWHFKQLTGDPSDNLPAGCDLSLIHLFEPPDDKKLWENRGMSKWFQQKLSALKTVNCEAGMQAEFKIYELGFTPPIKPLGERW